MEKKSIERDRKGLRFMELENLIQLIEAVSASELTGLKYEENGMKLHLTKKKDQVQVISAPMTIPAAAISTGEAANVTTTMMATDPATLASTMAAVGNPSGVSPENTGNTTAATETTLQGKIVESPLVGTFYAAPAEDAAPFVSVGDSVKKGQTLAIIEAMKLMNEIESEYDGIIEEILVKNGQPVEYGQPIFKIR